LGDPRCVRGPPARLTRCPRSPAAADYASMPLDPRAKRFLDRLAALEPPSVLALTVSERRESLSQLLSFSGPPARVGRIEERSLPGPAGTPLTVRIYTPAELGAAP